MQRFTSVQVPPSRRSRPLRRGEIYVGLPTSIGQSVLHQLTASTRHPLNARSVTSLAGTNKSLRSAVGKSRETAAMRFVLEEHDPLSYAVLDYSSAHGLPMYVTLLTPLANSPRMLAWVAVPVGDDLFCMIRTTATRDRGFAAFNDIHYTVSSWLEQSFVGVSPQTKGGYLALLNRVVRTLKIRRTRETTSEYQKNQHAVALQVLVSQIDLLRS